MRQIHATVDDFDALERIVQQAVEFTELASVVDARKRCGQMHGRRGEQPASDSRPDTMTNVTGLADACRRNSVPQAAEAGRLEGDGVDDPMLHQEGHVLQRACAFVSLDDHFNRIGDQLEAFEIARRGLGFTPEDRRIFSDLTVLENLDIGRQPPRRFADGAAAPQWTPERLFALFPNLAEMPDRPGGRMSGGEQQMLTVARTLMGNPLLVLLDEPSEGVAPLIVEQMANTIIELKKEGLSILLSEQNIHFAQLVSDRVYVLEKGQIQWQGTMAQLSGSPDIQRTYLTV